MNSVPINEVPKFLTPIPGKAIHAIQIENHFDAAHKVIISLILAGVTSYFNVRKATQEVNKNTIFSKRNSQQKLNHGICVALSSVDKNQVYSITENVCQP